MGKFGKEILSNQIPGWSTFYLDYKALKKVVSSLEASYGSSREAATGSLVPGHILNTESTLDLQALPPDALAPLSSASSGLREDERGPVFEAHRAAFFFKLERELTKVNPRGRMLFRHFIWLIPVAIDQRLLPQTRAGTQNTFDHVAYEARECHL